MKQECHYPHFNYKLNYHLGVRRGFKIQVSQCPPKWRRNGDSINPRSTSLCPSTAPKRPTGGCSGDLGEDDIYLTTQPLLAWLPWLARLSPWLPWVDTGTTLRSFPIRCPSVQGPWGTAQPSHPEGEPHSPFSIFVGELFSRQAPWATPRKMAPASWPVCFAGKLSGHFLEIRRVRHC